LVKMRVEGETGAGMVKAIVDGEFSLVDLEVDETLLEPDDIKALPRLIVKAVQNAQKNAKAQVMDKAKDLTGGMDIPGLDL
ncbi:MAG: YbaB/EbfC family nucleoid-associated protein, partial [Leptospirales bacterium]